MPTKTAKTQSDGFGAEERAAMKERAAELRAEGNEGAKRADGLQTGLVRADDVEPRGGAADHRAGQAAVS